MSNLEEAFLRLWSTLDATRGLPAPTREFQFSPKRRFRFDFAWPPLNVGVELHGGMWQRKKSRGGHNTAKGVQRDCEKHRLATIEGWAVLAYTSIDWEKRPVQVIEEVAEFLRQRAKGRG